MGNIEYFHEEGQLVMGLSSNKRGNDLASYKQITLQHMIKKIQTMPESP